MFDSFIRIVTRSDSL